MGKKRHEMSFEEREKERAKDRERMARKRQAMSEEERQVILAKERQRIARIRQEMSLEKRLEIRERERQRMAKRRLEMTEKERKEALMKDRLRFARTQLARNQQRLITKSSNQSYIEEFRLQPCIEQMKTEELQFDENRYMIQSPQMMAKSPGIASQMPVQKNLQELSTPQNVQKPCCQKKRTLAIGDHHVHVMSSIVALWKNKKLCDASIGNGSSIVMVHKVVLSAVCPKLLSVFNTDISSQKFLQINFPKEVSTQALNAFADYMYCGNLDLDPDILLQLKIIAKRLDMKTFEHLCDNYLLKKSNSLSTDRRHLHTQCLPLVSPDTSVPTLSPSSVLSVTPQSVPSLITQFVDVKQEITESELAHIKESTANIFDQESVLDTLDANTHNGCSYNSDFDPILKTEPIRPDNDKYGDLSNETYTSIPALSRASVQRTSSKLKSNVFETSFSDVFSEENVRSQSRVAEENPCLTLHETTEGLTVNSIPILKGTESIYPIKLLIAGGNKLPLSTHSKNFKHLGLFKTNELT